MAPVQAIAVAVSPTGLYWLSVIISTILIAAYSVFRAHIPGRHAIFRPGPFWELVCACLMPIILTVPFIATATKRPTEIPLGVFNPPADTCVINFNAFLAGLIFFGLPGYWLLSRITAFAQGVRQYPSSTAYSTSSALAKGRELAKFITLYSHIGQNKARSYLNAFEKEIEELRETATSSERKERQCVDLSNEAVELLFVDGLRRCGLGEWILTISEQHTIGGEGVGPALNMDGLTALAEEEEKISDLEKTVYPGTLSRKSRHVVHVLSRIVLPMLTLGLLNHFMLLSWYHY